MRFFQLFAKQKKEKLVPVFLVSNVSAPWYPTKLNPKNGSSIVINSRKCLVDNEEESPIFGKLDIILFYNATKRGVDTVDKYKESYSVAKTTNRLSMTSFYSMLNVGALNSFIILKQNINQPQMKRRIFLEELSKDLCMDFMVSCLTVLTHKKENPKLWKIEETKRVPPADQDTKGRCYSCDWKKNCSSLQEL